MKNGLPYGKLKIMGSNEYSSLLLVFMICNILVEVIILLFLIEIFHVGYLFAFLIRYT
ncbi:hypothetical protein [Aminipila terrae]|uniref:Uncharacterized protein n=1 Tax=Aminipila terrae TaxID=2697030 RepID=A0A6P1MCH2_9FIRM|nr:hypothetical protein [Aminipila terrae]QHI71712.1 hypothetical protein Ami3637_04330 [Aminipila terrae]